MEIHEGWEYNDQRTETVAVQTKDTNLTVLSRVVINLSPISETTVTLTFSITNSATDYQDGDLATPTPVDKISMVGAEATAWLDAVAQANEKLQQLLRRCADEKGRERGVIKTDQVNSAQPAAGWVEAREQKLDERRGGQE